jgi:hypothetical protein
MASAPPTPQDASRLPGPEGPGGVFAGYDDEHHPLGSYAAFAAVFATAFGGGLAALHRSGRPLPERVSAGDVVLLGVATHKLTRLIAKDRVTAFLRAPFSTYQEGAGHGEVEEAAKGTGLRKAVGELIICPYCLGQWVAGGFALGLVGAPRVTRLVAAMYAAETISDGLHLAYHAAAERS